MGTCAPRGFEGQWGAHRPAVGAARQWVCSFLRGIPLTPGRGVSLGGAGACVSDEGQGPKARQVAKAGRRGSEGRSPQPGVLLKPTLTTLSPARAWVSPGAGVKWAGAVVSTEGVRGLPRFPWLGGACSGSRCGRWGGRRGAECVRQWWTHRSGSWGCCPREPGPRRRKMGHSCTRPRGCRCAGRPSRWDTAWLPPPGGPWSSCSRCTGTVWPGPPWSTCRRTALRTCSPSHNRPDCPAPGFSGVGRQRPRACSLSAQGFSVLARAALSVTLNPDLPQPGPLSFPQQLL